MRPESIEERKARRKKDAVRGVLLFALLQVVTAAVLLMCMWIPDLPRWAVWMFGACALIGMLLLIPAFAALRQRFEEIEGGELDEAGKY